MYGQPREAAVFIGSRRVNLLSPEEENEKWLKARIELGTLRLQVGHSPFEPLARTLLWKILYLETLWENSLF